MQVKIPVQLDKQTIDTAKSLTVNAGLSLQRVVDEYDLPFSKATLGDIVNGNSRKVSAFSESAFRKAVGLPPLPVPKLTYEKTAGKPKRKRPPVYRPMLTLQHRAMLKQMGVTCAELIEKVYRGEE